MTIALYYSPGSCSFAPHVVLRDIGLTFELRKFSTADRSNYSPEYLAVNPKGLDLRRASIYGPERRTRDRR